MNNDGEFSLPVRVYIEDTDAGGIVFYVNYLKYMERARTEWMRARGLAKAAILDEGRLLVVASVQIDYKRSAQLDDALHVSARMIKAGRSYMVFAQEVRRDGQCLAQGTVKVACVDRQTQRPCAFPARLAQMMPSRQ